MIKKIFLSFVVTSCSAFVFCSDITVLQNDSEVLTGQLDNGLTYYIKENSYPANTAAMQLVVKVGSMHERDDEKGLAHFIEHLSFRGSKHFADGELHRYLESVGCSFGADHNAFTTFEYTCYQLDLTIENLDVLKNGLVILSDFGGRATLSDKVINIERGVVIEEMRLGERDANQRLLKNTFNLHYQDSDYPNHWPIGELSVLESANSELIRDFYKRWYQPKHMAIIAVGDFDQYEVERMIYEEFSSLENSDVELEYPSFDVEFATENQVIIQHDPECTDYDVAMIRFSNRRNNPPEDYTSDQIKKSLHERIIRNLINNRLFSLTHAATPPYRAAGLFKGPMTLYHNTSEVWSLCYAERPLDALYAQVEQLSKVIEYGFTSQELDQEKERIATSIEKELKELDSITHQSFVGEYINHYLLGWAFPTFEQENRIMLEKLDEISIDAINERARRGALEPWLISFAYPTNVQIHLPEDDLLQVIKQVKQQHLSPFESREEISKIMDPKYPKGEISSKEKDPNFAMYRYVLSNGMKVIVMPTEFKKDEVILFGYAEGGLNAFEGNDYHSARIAGHYAIESGIGDCSLLQISDLLHKKGVCFSHNVGNSIRSMSGSCSPNHLDLLFQVLQGAFTARNFDESVWERVQSNEREHLDNLSNDPENVFCDFVNGINFQDHEFMQEIDLDRVDPRAAKEAFELLFTDPSEFTFVIVGNVDNDLIEDQILTYLGSILPVKTNAQFHEIKEQLFPKATIVESFYRGNHEECDIVTSFQRYYEPSINEREIDYHVNTLNSILETRLLERIRHELGASYSVYVSEYHPLDRRNGIIEIGVTTNIRNKKQLQSIILEEVTRLTTGEIFQCEIDKCREIARTYNKKVMQTNLGWQSTILSHLLYEISMEQMVDYEGCLKKLTPESLKALAVAIYKDKPYTQLTWEQEG